MPIHTLFYDVDNTLYPPESGVWEAIAERIDRYLGERRGLPAAEIPARRTYYFSTYGTTMRGLEIEEHIERQEYLDFVHDVPLRELIQPNPALRGVLLRYPQRRIIFTNADEAHARRVLGVLGVEDCFESIIDVNTIAPYCKPQPEAFALGLRTVGSPAPETCILIDDTPANLEAARELGMTAVGVGEAANGSADYWVRRVEDLPQVLDGLLGSREGGHV